MANNNKFAVKNGLQAQNIEFLSPDRTHTINIDMLNSDTISVSGNSGQLFSITDSLTGSIYSVNDISGIPSIEVFDNGQIRLGQYSGNILLGTATDNATDKLQVNGSVLATTLKGNLDWSYIQSKPDPVITVTLTGDVTGTANTTLTDLASGTVSVATTIAANSVALGTDTTGNYMVNVSAGTGITVSHTQGEGSTATVGLTGQALALHNLATNGIIARTGSGTVAGRTITASTGISVSNGDGVSGNPTITNTDPGSSQNIFKNVAVSGQSTVVADSNNDTLTFVAGSGMTITTNASTDTITFSAAGGSSTWTFKTANYTASAGDAIIANTSGGSFTITLPASPAQGATVVIADGASWFDNNLTVARNGSTIKGLSEDLVMDVAAIKAEFVYSGTTWLVFAFASGADEPLATILAIGDEF